MMIAFELSMPSNNSWNGKWSGAAKFYSIVRSVRGEAAQAIVDTGYFSYAFGDGWVAGIKATAVDKAETARLRRKSDGFCGYDWMVDSIIRHGDIRIVEHA